MNKYILFYEVVEQTRGLLHPALAHEGLILLRETDRQTDRQRHTETETQREMVYGLLCYKQDTMQMNFNVSWTQRETLPSYSHTETETQREVVYGLLCYKQDTTERNFNVSWTQREALPSHHRHDISSASVLYCKVIFTVSSYMGLVHRNDDKPVDTAPITNTTPTRHGQFSQFDQLR